MHSRKPTPERLTAFSDGVFAVIITIMVLELKPPEQPSFWALLPLWSTMLSYAVSYLFIAIVWVNHHHLLRFAEQATARLIWWNFAHLFLVSLVPFSTAWVADTDFAAAPVSTYAGIFVLVNSAYLAFAWEVLAQAEVQQTVSARVRQMTRARSFTTVALFVAAAVISLWFPPWGFALICCTLFAYLRPEGLSSAGEDEKF
ncbi:MAG TPA: TMEM175 family protein [Bryobacteraceae bacterium]|nr:TMEM175 family protein [Bryobacteraceae bacterium]